ncbi:MFS transporter [Achromobacter aloeverae]|uniref:MFS transporter n=1 Tax=Achromobacter aloeverae TaxID=1750518 RepID=A0A4Q1HKE2_9BURK|nr:MFS transporter [Achromobacter aloeverae]RXN90501.1 MFS transporter [Achromobacter aloeverae]
MHANTGQAGVATPVRHQPVRAAAAAFFGTMIEWYDFYCYATAAALVFGDVFFATRDPFMGTLASLGTFAIGFFARPVGALVFGHLGDKVGRKRSLIITLMLMGVATTLIGLLPSYHSVGVVAAVLLVVLRLLQGVAVGGEWGGAVLIAAEHAPPKWRTFLASAPQYGSPIGLILATGVFRMVSDLPKEDFLSWGWRLPFLVSGVLVLIAFLIRRGVDESPEMEARLRDTRRTQVAPLGLVLRERKRALLLGIGLCLLGISGFYFVTTLMITYTTTYLKITRSQILDVITWAGVVELISFPIASWLATRFGERRFLVWVTALATLWSVPMMMLILTGDIGNIAIGILGAIFLIGAYYAVLAPYLPRAFPVEMRYTGISLSFQLCGAIFGGTTPLVGLWVANHYGLNWPPMALMFAIIGGVNFLCAVYLPTEERDAALGRQAAPMATQPAGR